MRPPEIAWDPSADLPPLAAGFQTCEEVKEDIELAVTGTIPSYVVGKLYRNGPGVYEATHKNGEISHTNHWFDGLTVVHRFVIDGETGRVHYKNRRICTEVLETMENAASKSDFKSTTFGNQDPCRGLLGNLFQTWRPYSRHPETGRIPTNIGVTLERVPTLGKLVSRTDFNRMAVLDGETLEKTSELGFNKLNPKAKGMATAAHGCVDPDTGAYFNYVYEHGPYPEYRVIEVNEKETRVLARFKDVASYMHSIAATKNYVIVILYSVIVSTKGMMKAVCGETSFLELLEFDPNLRTKFYLVSRAEACVTAVYDTDAFFCFHQVNAYDDAHGNVIVDLGRYNDGNVLNRLYRRQMMLNPNVCELRCSPTRYVLADIASAARMYKGDGKAVATTNPKILCDADLELMRVAPSVQMGEYRYTYGVSGSGTDTTLFNSLAKINVKTGQKQFYTPSNGACGEPIFLQNPQGIEEDDGVLLSVVLDLDDRKSYLAVLDARDMQEVARANVPQAVPLGFHGQFIRD